MARPVVWAQRCSFCPGLRGEFPYERFAVRAHFA